MWIKKLPGIVANAAVLILDIFVILMIAALFLHQQTAGERVKETITRFSTTSEEYYSEGEAYSQKSRPAHRFSPAAPPRSCRPSTRRDSASFTKEEILELLG